MADTSKAVSVFYEPGAPETVPLLLSQTDLLLHAHQQPSLFAQEELYLERSSGVVRPRNRPSFRTSSPYHKTVTFRNSTRSQTPYQDEVVHKKQANPVPRRSATPRDHDNGYASDASESSYSSDSSVQSHLSQHSDTFKIPKPGGEVGRPGRGGYNLEAELGLHPQNFQDLKALVNTLVDAHLDTTTAYSYQPNGRTQISKVCKDAIEKYPDLQLYSSCWPVKDLIKARLKYTSSTATQLRLSGGADGEAGSSTLTKGAVSKDAKSSKSTKGKKRM